jgi:S1-C subfamily serine protease
MSPRIDWEIAVEEGILLVEVVSDGPAAQAGLRAGDVIVNIGGEEVKDDQSFITVLHESEIGQDLEVVYWRGDSKNTTSVTPIESPRS